MSRPPPHDAHARLSLNTDMETLSHENLEVIDKTTERSSGALRRFPKSLGGCTATNYHASPKQSGPPTLHTGESAKFNCAWNAKYQYLFGKGIFSYVCTGE